MNYSTTNTAKQYYDVEVGTGQSGYEETMKIGLMYVSDYGYGASPENWTKSLGYVDGTNDYSNSTNTDNNWLYLGADEWTLSRRSDGTTSAFVVIYGGYVDDYTVNNVIGVRPAFYLASTATISSGTGTQSDPYILNLG